MLRLKQWQAVQRMKEELSKYTDLGEDQRDFDVAPARDHGTSNISKTPEDRLRRLEQQMNAAILEYEEAKAAIVPDGPKMLVDSVGVGFSYGGGGVIKVHYPTVDREKGTRHYGGGGISFLMADLPESYFTNAPNEITAERMAIWIGLMRDVHAPEVFHDPPL